MRKIESQYSDTIFIASDELSFAIDCRSHGCYNAGHGYFAI